MLSTAEVAITAITGQIGRRKPMTMPANTTAAAWPPIATQRMNTSRRRLTETSVPSESGEGLAESVIALI